MSGMEGLLGLNLIRDFTVKAEGMYKEEDENQVYGGHNINSNGVG